MNGSFYFPSKTRLSNFARPEKKWAGFLLARAGSAGSSSNLVDFQGALAVSFREGMVGFPKKTGKVFKLRNVWGDFILRLSLVFQIPAEQVF